MGQTKGVKRGQQVREKITYEAWQRFLDDFKRVRPHLSLRQISQRMGKNSPGWSHRAREHRSIVSYQDVKNMAELADELEAEHTEPEPDEGAEMSGDPEQRRAEFVDIVDELRDTWGMTWTQVARAFGYQGDDAARQAYKDGRTPRASYIKQGREALRALEHSDEVRFQNRGERFKSAVETLRDEHGYTDSQIAGVVGYTHPSNVERALQFEAHTPSEAKVQAIEDHLDALRTGKEEEQEEDDDTPAPGSDGDEPADIFEEFATSRRTILTADQIRWFVETAQTLLDHGVPKRSVADAAGYNTTDGLRFVLNLRNPPSGPRYDALRDAIEDGQFDDALDEDDTGNETTESKPGHSASDPLESLRNALLSAAEEAERCKNAYPAPFHTVLDDYRDRILEIATELE